MSIHKICVAMAIMVWGLGHASPSVAQSLFFNGFESDGNATVIQIHTTGLAERQVQLQLNAGEVIEIDGNGTRSFSTTIAHGDTYQLSITTQPDSGAPCQLASSTGIASGTHITVDMHCGSVNEWDVMRWNQGEWQ